LPIADSDIHLPANLIGGWADALQSRPNYVACFIVANGMALGTTASILHFSQR
jgi:hypothetical protein